MRREHKPQGVASIQERRRDKPIIRCRDACCARSSASRTYAAPAWNHSLTHKVREALAGTRGRKEPRARSLPSPPKRGPGVAPARFLIQSQSTVGTCCAHGACVPSHVSSQRRYSCSQASCRDARLTLPCHTSAPLCTFANPDMGARSGGRAQSPHNALSTRASLHDTKAAEMLG